MAEPEPIEIVLARLRQCVDPYGEPDFTVDPPVDDTTIEQWRASGLRLPGDLAKVACATEGVRGPCGIDLDLRDPLGRSCHDVLGDVVMIGHDGTGGYLYLDEAGRVWFEGHDPTCLTLAGRSIASWLTRIASWDPDEESPDRAPRFPSAVGAQRRVDVAALDPGEGFDLLEVALSRSGDVFVLS